MIFDNAVSLIKSEEIPSTITQTWADLGCGEGLFTVALSDVLCDGSNIYAIDKNINLRNIKSVQKSTRITAEKARYHRSNIYSAIVR
jgi:16S rRNA G1207 methylase RsmC